MTLPRPLPGLVINYNYLWTDEARDGHELGSKDRPAVVVMITDDNRVFVLPITHTPHASTADAIQIPTDVAKKAGLDARPSWIVIAEFNEFLWPGFDLVSIPGRNPATFAYGFLTSAFFNKVRDAWLALDEAGSSTTVVRDEVT